MRPVIRVYLYDENGERFFGEGPCRLLHAIEQTGSLRAAAQSDGEIALTDSLLADLEGISRQAHEETGFTYTPLSELAALN